MERAYGRLKILWERKKEDDPALEELIGLLEGNSDMNSEMFFKAADNIAWSKLESATFNFVDPAVKEVEPRHAYDLIRFVVAPADDRLGNNFLFKHGITYRWSLTLNEGKGPPMALTQERTTEPRVVQYVPRPGMLHAKVELIYDGKLAKHPAELSIPIRKSSDYGWRSIFRLTDVAALLFAILFASVTGLGTYYFGKYGFGSITDYIALFVWGAGVDQTKNFLQQLGKTSGTA